MGENPTVRVFLAILMGCLGASAFSQVSIFNSPNAAGNTAARNSWLAASSILSPDVLEDFEGYTVGSSQNGAPLVGGLTITDLTAPAYATVQSAGSFFGGSLPVGKGLALKENHTLRFDFTAPTAYVGMLTFDDSGSDVRVYLEDSSFVDFNNLDVAGSSGANAEFLGFFSAGPKIVRLDYHGTGGDGEWGIDNVEFAAVPEPGLLLAAGAGAALFFRRRRQKGA